jgi:uncharacterized protein YggE
MMKATYLLLVALLCAWTVAAQDTNSAAANVVTASGTGTVTIAADIAQVQLGVQFEAPNASQAQAEAANSAAAVVSALQSLNVSKLQTSSISLTQINNPTPTPSPIPLAATANGSSSTTGEDNTVFRASNTVSFEVPASQAGQAIDAAVAAGANNINSVSLVPSDAAVAQAQQNATRLAVSNAISYGRIILDELGCQVSGIGAVSLSPLYAPASSSLDTHTLAVASATTPVLAGEVDVTATVQVNLLQNCPGSAIDAINNGNTNANATTNATTTTAA